MILLTNIMWCGNGLRVMQEINIIIKQTVLRETLLKIFLNLSVFIFFYTILISKFLIAAETWVVDNKISEISFEVPVLFASNVEGKFIDFDGLVQIDINENHDNKAIFYVSINSIETNYKKYRNLLLGPIFFDSMNFPLSVLDTKNFQFKNNDDNVLDVELTIKNKSKNLPINLKIIQLTNDLVQVKGELFFNRLDFNIGIDKWRNTTFLKDRVRLFFNIFLIKD